MISSTTPYKVAEIIRDTWPGIYRKPGLDYNTQKTFKYNEITSSSIFYKQNRVS
jgi:hypothetical protein